MIAPPIPNEQAAQMQAERASRARLALASGEMIVTDQGGGRWSVTGGHFPYTVTRTGDDTWRCDCPDFAGRCQVFGLLCKHIQGVRLTLQTGPHDQLTEDHTRKGDTRMDNPNIQNGWVKLYHPEGPLVTIPISPDTPITAETAVLMFSSVSALLQAGWLVELPGLEDGEHVEAIGHLVRRIKVNDDETETPVVDLYPERGNFRILGKYLNTADDVQAFEAAAGVRLLDLPLYEGDNAIERGKNPKVDRFVTHLPQPAKVIWKLNPDYEGPEDKKHPKRLFVRWGHTPAGGQPAAEMPAYGDGSPVDVSKEAEWNAYTSFRKANDNQPPKSREALREWALAAKNGNGHNGKH